VDPPATGRPRGSGWCLGLLVVVAALVTSCGAAGGAAAPTSVPEALASLEMRRIWIDGVELSVAIAADPARRARGLTGITHLGGLDGMLFVFEEDTAGGFWMKDTLIPLDIAFYAADGRYVDGFRMEPCTTDPCPVFTPSAPYRYALETPAGSLEGGGRGSRLRVTPRLWGSAGPDLRGRG